MASFTPPQNKHHYEADTVKELAFFMPSILELVLSLSKTYVRRKTSVTVLKMNALKQRKRLDDAASRRIETSRSGRSKKMSSDLMNKMLDPQLNSVRDQS
jgi:hypothetical protein